MTASPFPFHLMAKPVGGRCNLSCEYCFYLEKVALYAEAPPLMSDALLADYIRSCFATHPEEVPVIFTWQGGEPTLAGLTFFRKAVTLEKRYGSSRRYENSFQTNGLLLDDAWAGFFAENDFLVGLSIDGPLDIHDAHRRTVDGKGSHADALRALRVLRRHGVRHNTLTCVSAASHGRGLEIYRFLKDEGVRYMQFTPVVERAPNDVARDMGLRLGMPGGAGDMTAWSVGSLEFGEFLTDVFVEWVKNDVGDVFVMNFEWALANYLEKPGAACHHQPLCGRCLVLEHDGGVFPCDHFVYPDGKLGILGPDSLLSMVDAGRQWDFGESKGKTLSERCRECPHLKGCWGGCPKHRFHSVHGEQENYLCSGYEHFFKFVAPFLKTFAYLDANGRPLSDIMGMTVMAKR